MRKSTYEEEYREKGGKLKKLNCVFHFIVKLLLNTYNLKTITSHSRNPNVENQRLMVSGGFMMLSVKHILFSILHYSKPKK
ncbi:hypothetical protein C1H46_045503 [Malus baccata]|uniref:Uncharacterized protein n=1 Tax=Malus baccata TaxID=106549 RepID=A0A540K417_MALBA|nr:hypothetical protein C1H46_045503 [Malus baccata]